jgi:hypothetical protein
MELIGILGWPMRAASRHCDALLGRAFVLRLLPGLGFERTGRGQWFRHFDVCTRGFGRPRLAVSKTGGSRSGISGT